VDAIAYASQASQLVVFRGYSTINDRSKEFEMTGWGKWLSLPVLMLICMSAGGLGAFATTSEIGTWYRTIAKPSWNPPDSVFGPVWTTLYLMMGFSAWLVWIRAARGQAALPMGMFAVHFLWHASDGLGVRRDRYLVGRDHRDDVGVHASITVGCRAVGAVLAMGKFCERVEPYDLAIERRVIRRNSRRSVSATVEVTLRVTICRATHHVTSARTLHHEKR
jgi:hypothetical protein